MKILLILQFHQFMKEFHPMHCLFLGIARWIIKRIWIDEGVLTPNDLKKIQEKMNQFKIPADLGRIPGNIERGEGFSNYTADQWRIFFMIYATTSFRILEIELMEEAHERLIKIIKLIEVHYGRVKITPNLHLSLHLCDCSNDFGPLYAFWCFSFERMNGILGSLPTSNRQIEPEIMRRIMNDNRIGDIISSDIQTKGLELLEDRPTTVDLPNGQMEHNLAYIHESCNVELWKSEFYDESRDCIIPVHNILCRFIPSKYRISTRSNAIEYLAINPINRKLQIR
ncbi:hypothetical protein GLOIN_2v1883106 [Rhizophagus irregularis DAOM 181602=DAOM 197198]|nr:hypothetical protein GLOIN_2v1883106 [Rhizophagus irregularis DAOM 181602=DAOM 197198]